MMKVPYMAVIGKREAEGDTVAVRVRGEGKKQEIVPVAEFIDEGGGGSEDKSANSLNAATERRRRAETP